MSEMKITRRMIDPITFQERVGVEFIPRLEDFVLDEQLAGAMLYLPPKKLPSLPPPKVDSSWRPPTPPRAKKRGENPNVPRKPDKATNPILSPKGAKGKLLLSPSPGSRKRSGVTKKGIEQLTSSLHSILEDGSAAQAAADAKNNGSDSSLQRSPGSNSLNNSLRASLTRLSMHNSIHQIGKLMKEVRFADEVELNHFSRMSNSILDEIFYASEDLANFRYEAFMEEAGLDINDFD